MEKVSIIVPVYNSEIYLEKCINSIINQTYKNLEILLINDGSKDNSLQILYEYAKKDLRIRVIDRQNNGVSATRNLGIEKSTGEYICFIDADDWIECNMIEKLYNTIKQKDVDAVRCNYYTHLGAKRIIGKSVNMKDKICHSDELKNDILNEFIIGNINSFVWLLIVKSDILKNKIKFVTKVHMMEDTIFYVELLYNIKTLYFLNEPLYHYVYNKSGACANSKYILRNIESIIEGNVYIKNIISQNSNLCIEQIKKINALHLNSINTFLYYLFKYKINKKDLIDKIKGIREKEELNSILNNYNTKYIKVGKKIITLMLKQKKYNVLYFCYYILSIPYIIKRHI